MASRDDRRALADQIRDLRAGYREDPESSVGQEAWNLMADLVESEGDMLVAALEAGTVMPGHIMLPTNADEAKAMWLVGERWMRDHAPAVLRDVSPGGCAEGMRERAAEVAWGHAECMEGNPPTCGESVARMIWKDISALRLDPSPPPGRSRCDGRSGMTISRERRTLSEAEMWALRAIADGQGTSPANLGQAMMDRPGVEEKRRGGNRSSPQGLGRIGGTMMARLEKAGVVSLSRSTNGHWHPTRAVITAAGRTLSQAQSDGGEDA